jgi:Kef-type K+ transport system membrane component KefB
VTPPQHFLAILGVVLFFGLLLPQLLRPLHLPFTTSLILVGSLLGPHGLGYVLPDPSLVLFGFLGAMFQMLLAGSETQSLDVASQAPDTARLTLLNGLLPAALGIAIARGFDYGWTASLFVGTVFLSSSVMLVFGMVDAAGVASTRAGRLVKSAAVFEDLGASMLAFLLFQTLEPHQRFPLPILAGLLLASVIVLRMFLPEIVAFLFRRIEDARDGHEDRLRLVVGLLLLVIFGYSTLDVHPVIAAFLVGFALAEIPESNQLRDRLESLGYGLFIPVFLFMVGVETDFRVLWNFDPRDALAITILIGAIGSKLAGGYLGSRWAGIERHEARIIAIASTAKLAVPLSATYAARDLGILDSKLFSALVIVAVATSMLAPLFLAPLRRREVASET